MENFRRQQDMEGIKKGIHLKPFRCSQKIDCANAPVWIGMKYIQVMQNVMFWV
jgi:hypothetical protein